MDSYNQSQRYVVATWIVGAGLNREREDRSGARIAWQVNGRENISKTQEWRCENEVNVRGKRVEFINYLTVVFNKPLGKV